jgi:hypothetical protein
MDRMYKLLTNYKNKYLSNIYSFSDKIPKIAPKHQTQRHHHNGYPRQASHPPIIKLEVKKNIRIN